MVWVFQKLSTWTFNPVLLRNHKSKISSPSFPQEEDGLIFLDGDGAVSVMERRPTAGSRQQKNTIPARARREREAAARQCVPGEKTPGDAAGLQLALHDGRSR